MSRTVNDSSILTVNSQKVATYKRKFGDSQILKLYRKKVSDIATLIHIILILFYQ